MKLFLEILINVSKNVVLYFYECGVFTCVSPCAVVGVGFPAMSIMSYYFFETKSLNL